MAVEQSPIRVIDKQLLRSHGQERGDVNTAFTPHQGFAVPLLRTIFVSYASAFNARMNVIYLRLITTTHSSTCS